MRFSSVFLASCLAALVTSSPHRLHKRDWSFNTDVFEGRTLYINQEYAANLASVAASFRADGDEENALKTEKVAATASTFNWYSSISAGEYFREKLANASTHAAETGNKLVFPFVVYNMPDRDCSSEASAGELQFNKGGLERYQAMIDEIKAAIEQYPELNYAVSVEPDAIGNMVTNIGNNRCQPELFDQYIEAYGYAIRTLQLPNVALYIDVAHSQWLGWPANIPPLAKILERIMTAAGPDAKIRGYSTNVSNYNPYKFTGDVTSDNPNYDEFHYAQSLGAEVASLGLPAHFIIDVGRSGNVDALRDGVWCNLLNSGYGPFPTDQTGEEIVDALVWIKPPGESDGSGIEGAPGYDPSCAGPHNTPGAPRAGQWFLEYVKGLVINANPPIELDPVEPEPEEPAVGPWQQCGGKGYTGSTKCAAGTKCHAWNEWYAQCVPQ